MLGRPLDGSDDEVCWCLPCYFGGLLDTSGKGESYGDIEYLLVSHGGVLVDRAGLLRCFRFLPKSTS